MVLICKVLRITYYSKQEEKIMVLLVRILMSKSGFEDEVLIHQIDSWGCEACHH
jgi:hypothetical protein